MHNSNLNYKHMLQCTKVGSKITCVSLGEFLGPMQEMRMKLKHLGIVARPRTLRNIGMEKHGQIKVKSRENEKK